MIPVKHIDPEDLPLYAMQLLPEDETAELTLHLQHSVEARRVLAEFYGDLSAYAHTAEMHSPPAQARQRLMKHVAREKKIVPIHLVPQAQEATYTPRPVFGEVTEMPRRSVAARVLPWVGWGLAAGLALEAGNLYQQRERLTQSVAQAHTQLKQTVVSDELANTLMETVKDPNAVHVMLTSTGLKPPPQGRATYVADKGTLIFLASNLEPLQPYKTYELWVIPAYGDAIPAGTFQPDAHGNASVILPQLAKGVAAKTFGVTIEDGEGSSQPTMPIVLKGTAS